MTVWPSIAATPAGRVVGRLAAVDVGFGRFFTVGKFLAVASIPIALAAFAWKLMPGVCRRYRVTNRRVVVQKGLKPSDERSIGLDEFDAIEILVLPGQHWLRAGDVIFRSGENEVLRLGGVAHPESFRQVCLKARTAYVSVRDVLKRQEPDGG